MAVTADQTRRHLLARADAERRLGAIRAERLLQSLQQARELLVAYGAGRVWLFGSLAAGHPRPDSDIDLAAEGIDTGVYFKALADLMGLFQAPVDLVRWEDAPESLRNRVLTEGREL
jgi:predicted nucleotidyltransferase